MNGLPYYKAYPRDFVEGTIGMPFELKGAYRLVLDLIYMQGGKLPDDARYISGLLGCSVKKWNSLRIDLLATGKVVVTDDYLTNHRAISEIETLGKYQSKQSENASRPNKNNKIEKPPLRHTEPEPDTEDNSLRSLAPQAASKRKSGSRLPSDWVLPRLWGQWALDNIQDATVEFIRSQAEQFKDYWISKSGSGATKLDWEATWRNWMRTAAGRRQKASSQKPTRMEELRSNLRERIENAGTDQGSADPEPVRRLSFLGGTGEQ